MFKKSIGLINSDNLVIFKFWNSKCYLNDNFANNEKKLECLHISKFLPFKLYEACCLKKLFR